MSKLSNTDFQKYKMYYLVGITLIFSWLIYLISFWHFYQEMSFWVDKGVRYIVQLIFISSFYLTEVMVYTSIYFLLLLSSLFLSFFYFFENKKEGEIRKITWVMIFGFGFITFLCSCVLFITLCWPYFLAIFIASFVILFITYAITKYLYEDNQDRYIDNECIKKAGPFTQLEEAETYSNEFISYWAPYFIKHSFRLVYEIKHRDEGYLVEIYTLKNKNESNSFS
ncbi:hypothetical protein [Enterococcus sp. AZ126]|uniref:hypothetical protein n=1 Tax=Enterococcus sp. AZ126 TaxID=2774635 RepID=UPI003F22FF37